MKAWSFGLFAAGALFTGSHAYAQHGGAAAAPTPLPGGSREATPPSTSPAPSTRSLEGRVQSFDRTSNTLTLSGTDKILKVGSTTQITKAGARATLDDVKEGDQVRASYSGTGSTVDASSLDITPAAAAGSQQTTGSPDRADSMGTGGSRPGAAPKAR